MPSVFRIGNLANFSMRIATQMVCISDASEHAGHGKSFQPSENQAGGPGDNYQGPSRRKLGRIRDPRVDRGRSKEKLPRLADDKREF